MLVAITALMFSLVALILAGVAFLASASVVNSMLTKQPPPNITVNTPEPTHTPKEPSDDDNHSDDYKEGYTYGKEQMWTSYQLCMFDMYVNMEILDYETQIEIVGERMNKVMADDDFRKDLIASFTKYMEEQDDDSSDGY